MGCVAEREQQGPADDGRRGKVRTTRRTFPLSFPPYLTELMITTQGLDTIARLTLVLPSAPLVRSRMGRRMQNPQLTPPIACAARVAPVATFPLATARPIQHNEIHMILQPLTGGPK
jgi:hypothetical protein